MIELENGNIKAFLDEHDGLTVTSLCYKGKDYIALDEAKIKSGGTYGIPILFPTPNRVKNDCYTFNGRRIKGFRHGFLRHMDLSSLSLDGSKVKTTVHFDKTNEAFPYDADLTISIALDQDAITWTFLMENKDKESLSYGLALHPFFKKEEDLRVRTNIKKRIALDPDCYPTGDANDDIQISESASLLNEDSLFLNDGSINALLIYKEATLKIFSSDDFIYTIIYTLPEREFICVEPQSSLTDAHNMYAKGFKELSNLTIVESGKTKESTITMKFEEE